MSEKMVVMTLGEFFARKTDRRTFVGKASKVILAGAAALSMGVGSKMGMTYTSVLAADCQCAFPNPSEPACPDSACVNTGGCASPYNTCRQGDDPACLYPAGYWTSPCSACGGGGGFIYCYDCKLSGQPACGCKSICWGTRPA